MVHLDNDASAWVGIPPSRTPTTTNNVGNFGYRGAQDGAEVGPLGTDLHF